MHPSDRATLLRQGSIYLHDRALPNLLAKVVRVVDALKVTTFVSALLAPDQH